MTVTNEVLDSSMQKLLNQNKTLTTSATSELQIITDSQTNKMKTSPEIKNKNLPITTAEWEKTDFRKDEKKT